MDSALYVGGKSGNIDIAGQVPILYFSSPSDKPHSMITKNSFTMTTRNDGIHITTNLGFDMRLAKEFAQDCLNIKRDYSRFDLVLKKFMESGSSRSYLVDIYNMYISHSIPCPSVISIIYDTYINHLRTYPNAKLVDLGTGNGIYPWLLKRKGLSENNIIAVDIKVGRAEYWDNVITDLSYTPNIDDIVFISWGYGRYPSLDRYLLAGGKCVIIIGKENGGCTLPSDLFRIDWDKTESFCDFTCEITYVNEFDESSEAISFIKSLGLATGNELRGDIPSDNLKKAMKGWNTKIYPINTANLNSQDYLSINTKYE